MTARASLLLFDPHRALGRMGLASLIGVSVAMLMQLRFSWGVSLLGGWNAAGFGLVSLAWRTFAICDEQGTAKRAAAEDPGRNAVYVLVVLTSVASLLAATVLAHQARGITPSETGVLLALCLVTVALSWTLTHTAFTLRYAHLYYREDKEGIGGIDFPGGAPPSYSDFAYFAFTVGMCFQVSDATISSRQIRGTVLRHAALSFFYNTAILAFVLNLVFGRAG